jgi:hypothetical protein
MGKLNGLAKVQMESDLIKVASVYACKHMEYIIDKMMQVHLLET